MPAIVSILHRITGAFLFLLIPGVLWLWQFSLTYDGFESIHQWLDTIYVKLLVFAFFIPLVFHVVAGVRHLLSDIHIGVSKETGRLMALLTFVVSALILVMMGVWLW